MQIISSYGVELRKQNIPIRQTLEIYRSAVSYLIGIYVQVWEKLAEIPDAKRRFNAAEHLVHTCLLYTSGSAVKHHQNRRRTEGPASCIADTDGRSGHFGTGLTVQNAHAGDIVIHQKTHNKITFSGEIRCV